MLGDVVDNRAWNEAADRGVGTPVIVEVNELAKRMQALAVGPVGPGICPLVEQRPDEPLRLAVGLRPEGPGALVADVEAGEGIAIGVAAIARAVVGEDPL